MNRTLGRTVGALNALMVLGFAVSMLLGSNFGSYATSVGIALSYVGLACALAAEAPAPRRGAALLSAALGAMYALCNTAVYFTQMTTVRLTALSGELSALLDYQRYGLLFQLDLLGYGLMALSTFFAGLALAPQSAADRWLRGLLLVHGAFAPGCFLLPVLGVFREGMAGGDQAGTLALLCWCAYFLPIGVLTALRFRPARREAAALPPRDRGV